MFLCDKCGLQFQIIEELESHLRDDHYQPSKASVKYNDTDKIFCPRCFINFKHQRSLTRHLRYKTCLRCRFCKKTFDSKVLLDQHNYTHFENLHKSMDQEKKRKRMQMRMFLMKMKTQLWNELDLKTSYMKQSTKCQATEILTNVFKDTNQDCIKFSLRH